MYRTNRIEDFRNGVEIPSNLVVNVKEEVMKILTAVMLLALALPASAQFDDSFSRTRAAVSFNQDYAVPAGVRGVSVQVEYSTTAPSTMVTKGWNVSVSADSISSDAAHGFTVGYAVLYSSNNKALGGLTAQTTYYVIPLTDYSFKLSDTSTGAVAGVTVNLTSITDAALYTFAPIAFATATQTGIQWQGSNDGTTFYDLTGSSFPVVAISSITYAQASGGLFAFTEYPYGWLRARALKPTWGGITYSIRVHGRR